MREKYSSQMDWHIPRGKVWHLQGIEINFKCRNGNDEVRDL